MKKLFLSFVAIAAMVFASSCQQEKMEAELQGGSTVTYTVEIPELIGTRAVGDGSLVDQLVYAVYRIKNSETEEQAAKENLANTDVCQLVYQKVQDITGKSSTVVPLELINDQRYVVVFWAQDNNAWFDAANYHFGSNGVNYPTDYSPNNDKYDAFAGVDVIGVDGSASKNITLTRPFGQLNIATNLPETFTAEVNNTKVTILEGAAVSYNVATGKGVAQTESIVFEAEEPLANENLKNYDSYISMNYVFAPDQQTNIKVKYEINTKAHGTITNEIVNVPVAKNYKTNIVGNLLTSKVDYNVTLEKEWGDNGKDIEVLDEGVVKNINGDYEVTTASGFAYAINNLFAEGGTFYIHPGTYDFTGLVVVPQPTKPGAILNVKANEIPVVTRSTNGFEIIGLDVNYLVSEVVNGSQAIFSGLVLPEDTKLVGTNNGVVGVSGCSNEDTNVPAELIGENGQNGKVVNTVSMASVDEINEAMEKGLKLIELTGDITGLTEIFTISSSVTIDGCGHKLTSSAGRAINVDGVDGVTIKNLVIECTGERAINIIQNATNVTIDNVTATAANYTVNVAASAPSAVVNIKNSTLTGCNTVNVAAPNTKVTVNNSTINCNDNNTTAGEAYSALCLNKAAIGAEIIAENTVVNVTEGSDSSKGRNGAEDGTVIINGSTEGVTITVFAITYPDSDYYYGFESLEAAIEFAKEDDVITLIRDITVNESLVIEEGKTVVLDLNGKTITGTMPKSVGAVVENNGTLTIKNGTISSTAANGGSAISNNGTLTVEDATINGASVRENDGWPSYPVNNYSNATLKNVVINGYQGAIASNAAGTTTLTDCTINKEYLNTSSHVFYINHADAKVVVNSGTYTHKGMDGSLAYVIKGEIIVNDGTFTASNGGYGMAALTNGKIVVNGGDFQPAFQNWGGSIKVSGGTFAADPKNYLADGYKANKNAEGKWEVVEKTYVAQIGDNKYESIEEAVNAAQTGETITFLADIKQVDGVVITDKNLTIDLNNKIFTVSNGASTNNRNFKINGSSVVTIQNGTMVAAGDYSSGAYGTIRTEGAANVTLTNVKLYNYRGNGLNVKALGGTTITITDSEVYSNYGGGIEAAGGTIELTNVKVEQKGMYTAPYNSMTISVNGGGTVTVNSGTYSTECITAEEANNQGTSHGPWCAGVLNSGGTLIIKGGTFSNDNFGDNTLATYARGLLLADTGANIQIKGGTFNALKAIVDVTNNLGDASRNPSVTLAGGVFSADPRISGLYASHLISVVEGKAAVEGANGLWTLIDAVTSYEGLTAAFEQGGEIVLGNDITVAETLTLAYGKRVVLNLNGKTLDAVNKNVVKNNGGNLTIKNGKITRTGDEVGYSVNNASGEIAVENATIERGLYTSGSKMTATDANISHEQSSRHAIYAWNCEVTINSGTFHSDNAGNATLMASGSSIVTINGGTFSIADGRSSLGWTSSMIDQNSTAQVLVKGGLFNGGFRINSADTKLTIEGGEFNTNNGSAFTDYSGTKVVKGGKFTDAGAQNWAKKYIAEGYEMNANGVVVAK